MATSIITELTPVVKRPRKQKLIPNNVSPVRMLAAAVVLKAVDDYYYPNTATPKHARCSAEVFLSSSIGSDLLCTLLGREQYYG